jgi:hypothetical protein
METSLVNPQKPRALNQEVPIFIDFKQLDHELQQLLAAANPSQIALFLEKHPGFLLHRADDKLNGQLKKIYAAPSATNSLNPSQIHLLQDVEYLCQLDQKLQTRSLPFIYLGRKGMVEEINSLIPKKNQRLRQQAHNRIILRLVRRHLKEQCPWLKSKETQITQGLENALSNLFYQGFQIENENPKFLEASICYTLPVLEQLGPHLQEVSNLSHRAVLLAAQIGRATPALAGVTKRINSQGQLGSIRSSAGITSTIDTYSTVYQRLLQRPVERAIQQEIRREILKETAELSHLPYHPFLHGGTPN